MRTSGHLLLFGAVAAVAAIASAAPVQAASSGCAARGSSTLAASRSVRVYYLPKRLSREPSPRDTTGLPGRTFACLYSSGKRVSLGVHGDRVLGSFHISGQFVAFTSSDNAARRISIVEVVDVRHRRMTLRNYVPNTNITSLILAPNGSAAWIRAAEAGASVMKFEAGVGTGVVDPGPTVAIHSLALATGSGTYPDADAAIYWINAGQALSAPLH